MRNLWLTVALMVLIIVATMAPSADAAPTGTLTATVYQLPIAFPIGGAAMKQGEIITQVGSITERKVWEYNTTTGTLTVVYDDTPCTWNGNPCIVPTANAGVAHTGKVLYLTGGAGTWLEDALIEDVRRYDPITKQVTTAHTMPDAYIDGTTGWDPVRRQVLLFAGANGKNYLNTLRVFDPERGTFETRSTLPRSGDNMCAVYVPSRDAFIVGGGHSGGQVYSDFYEVQPSGAWRLMGNLPDGTDYPACHVYQGHLIVAGGDYGATGKTTNIYAMHIETGAVSLIGQLPYPYAGYSYVGDGPNLWLMSGGKYAMRVVLE